MEGNELQYDRTAQTSAKGTFEVKVRFLQNATWQGEILWLEENKKQNFRSVLEMLRLMDEALGHDTEVEQSVVWEG